jgi:hypothetical protein
MMSGHSASRQRSRCVDAVSARLPDSGVCLATSSSIDTANCRPCTEFSPVQRSTSLRERKEVRSIGTMMTDSAIFELIRQALVGLSVSNGVDDFKLRWFAGS